MVFDSTASLRDTLAAGAANDTLAALAAAPARQPLEYTQNIYIYIY